MKNLVRVVRDVVFVAATGAMLVSCGQNGAASGPNSFIDGGIVGGQSITGSEFESVVGIVTEGQLTCTGNLVSQTKILTAAHCVAPFQYGSSSARAMAAKVDAEVLRMAGDLETYETLGRADQRRLVKAAVKEVVEREFADVKIYLGNGTSGNRAQTGQDLVASVSINDEAMAFVQAQFLKLTTLKEAEDDAVAYNASFDVARLSLKEAVTDRNPVPVIDPSEHADAVTNGMDVTLVGFGLTVDRRFLSSSMAILSEISQQMEAETDETRKNELMEQFLQEFEVYNQLQTISRSSGDKQKVDVKLENYTHEELTLRKKGRELQGACQGDSGGPVFARLGDGSYRQIGVIVTVDFCGNHTHASPVID